MRKMLLLSLSILAAAGLSACSDDEDEVDAADVEACEHLQEGPAAPLTAVPAADDPAAPAVSNDHRRYDITLVDVAGGQGGSVRFAVSEATDYVLFTSAAVPLSVVGPGGPVDIEESTPSFLRCTQVRGRHVVPLAVGTHVLTFGPAPGTPTVSLVIEEAAGHTD